MLDLIISIFLCVYHYIHHTTRIIIDFVRDFIYTTITPPHDNKFANIKIHVDSIDMTETFKYID